MNSAWTWVNAMHARFDRFKFKVVVPAAFYSSKQTSIGSNPAAPLRFIPNQPSTTTATYTLLYTLLVVFGSIAIGLITLSSLITRESRRCETFALHNGRHWRFRFSSLRDGWRCWHDRWKRSGGRRTSTETNDYENGKNHHLFYCIYWLRSSNTWSKRQFDSFPIANRILYLLPLLLWINLKLTVFLSGTGKFQILCWCQRDRSFS